MKRFILRCNIERFERLAASEQDAATLARVRGMLAAARREYALATVAELGANPEGSFPRFTGQASQQDDAGFSEAFRTSRRALMLIDPAPGFRIVDINAAYEAVSWSARQALVGRSVFDVFPDNPDHEEADGVSNLTQSLRTAAEMGRPHAMAVQRYDVRNADGAFVERYWLPVNSPVFGDDGRLLYLLHEVEEASAERAAAS